MLNAKKILGLTMIFLNFGYLIYGLSMMKIKLVMILLQKLLKSRGLLKILIKIKVKLNMFGKRNYTKSWY